MVALFKASMRVGSHYPERTYKTVLINKPLWASFLLALVSTAMSSADQRNMKKKMISFSPRRSFAGLCELVDAENIPQELGGSSTYPLGQAPDERALYKSVRRSNRTGTLDADSQAPPPPHPPSISPVVETTAPSEIAESAPLLSLSSPPPPPSPSPSLPPRPPPSPIGNVSRLRSPPPPPSPPSAISFSSSSSPSPSSLMSLPSDERAESAAGVASRPRAQRRERGTETASLPVLESFRGTETGWVPPPPVGFGTAGPGAQSQSPGAS
mmetsp:Transcript_13880/g.27587  ORF Transcript_13880/g.27587 Transcript_13880/m.27587 type:complete len:269 (+) Transcript_13880:728-1534(+)